ncbi:transglycosylase domain-containing protein [Allosphingosinicella sp.]|uniref:transglycosylase domain-containing protein n=1 Tax=Allosphingosinicella sp. TaxID=2823234 RepID=UPI002EFAAFF8
MMRMFRRAATQPSGDPPVPGSGASGPPSKPKRTRWQRIKRALLIFGILFVLIVAWLALTAPLSKSLEPINAPSLTILSAEGEPIARRGAIIDEPVDVARLPDRVWQPFVAIEDRNFRSHFGISIRGSVRALLRNLGAGEVRQGGSTITQQLAKTSFLSSERTLGRKVQEALISFWLEAWLSKDEILSRYLSNVYFGDNVYGLRAAARHYFSVEPEELTVPQAAMLAAIVNAPSRLAPTRNLRAAQARARLVMREMVEANMLSQGEFDTLRPARLRLGRRENVPTGTYFADWILSQFEEEPDGVYGEREIRTTLEGDLQRLAVRTVRRAGLGRAQVALVAMRPDGRVVAMVGGRNYSESSFNRATQARRQAGSSFKLFVYLAAFRAGATPETVVNDAPVVMGRWRPQNYEGRYRGPIRVRDAVAFSSNSASIQFTERVGRHNVIRAARDLGITSPLRPEPTLALGTASVSLIEMTAAYASVAAGYYPVRPYGIAKEQGWLAGWWQERQSVSREPAFPMLRDVLYAVPARGTGTAARLEVPTFGKTGTTQDYRDAWFFGFAQDLIVGVWVGNDNNSPMPGVSGGGIPARIWRSFMVEALGDRAHAAPDAVPLIQADKAPASAEPANSQPAPDTSPIGELPPPVDGEVPDSGDLPDDPGGPPEPGPERPDATTPPQPPVQREQPPPQTSRPRETR